MQTQEKSTDLEVGRYKGGSEKGPKSGPPQKAGPTQAREDDKDGVWAAIVGWFRCAGGPVVTGAYGRRERPLR